MASKIIIDRPRRIATTRTVALSPRGTNAGPVTYTYAWNCDTTTSGTSNPKYLQQIAARSNASTSYSLIKKKLKGAYASHRAIGRFKNSPYPADFESKHEGWPVLYQHAFAALPIATTVKGAAVASFYAKVAEEQHQFKGLTFLGELRQTVDTIGSLIKDGLDMLRALWTFLRGIRRNLRRLLSRRPNRQQRRHAYASALKSISGRYLQFVFGIQPLIQDIEALYTVMCEERVEVIRLHAQCTDSDSETTSSTVAFCNGMCWGRAETTTSTRVKTVCRGAMAIEKPAVPNGLLGTADRLGISLREVIPTLWELTPFSFLVDYFVNVSDLINTGMYADQRFVYAVASTKQLSTVRWVLSPGGKGDDRFWSYEVVDWNVSAATLELESFQFTRENITPALATIRFSLPTSAKRIANMVALFIQWRTSHFLRESSQ